ncbi:hypothetical protein Micbo1qcDRAFT_171163 [Microdochium bolleyi]|uniref:Uncharacterized protein n=1 Tax=Microdochium bolleyi TaxID=196109 RepID=A0A136JK17_9PEZI|nr:hypothetical protein Micbo1qcDRAFT_171163 [Microdochium bolleyi]
MGRVLLPYWGCTSALEIILASKDAGQVYRITSLNILRTHDTQAPPPPHVGPLNKDEQRSRSTYTTTNSRPLSESFSSLKAALSAEDPGTLTRKRTTIHKGGRLGDVIPWCYMLRTIRGVCLWWCPSSGRYGPVYARGPASAQSPHDRWPGTAMPCVAAGPRVDFAPRKGSKQHELASHMSKESLDPVSHKPHCRPPTALVWLSLMCHCMWRTTTPEIRKAPQASIAACDMPPPRS